MGDVYRAPDTRLDRIVAIKAAGERLASPDQPNPALSPDGTELAYVTIRESG